MEFGSRVKKLRKEHHWTQKQLGKMMGLNDTTVSNWENGNTTPTIDELVILVRLLSVSSDYILGIEDRQHIVIEGLSDNQISAIRNLIESFQPPNPGESSPR